MRKGLKILCVLLAAGFMSTHVSAAVSESMVPYWETTSSVNCSITFSGTTGVVNCMVRGKSGTTKIEGDLVLYEDGVEIYTWPISTNTSSVSILDSFTGESGISYTLELDVEVTRNGIVESIETNSTKTCP